MRNKIIGIAFLVILFCTGISIKFYDKAADILNLIWNHSFACQSGVRGGVNEQIAEDISNANKITLDSLPFKNNMVELNGSILKRFGVRSFYNLSHGMNITSDGYNVGRYPWTSTDYEVGQMISFKEYLDAKGIKLLYVSEPAKYIDDSFYAEQFGGESFLNRNTDLFLSRIAEAGIDYLDLRECIREEAVDPLSLFYKTDHHWTVPASEWAAGKIAEKLNEGYGYCIDAELYDLDHFNAVHYDDAWLGEQGRLVAKSYIGLDDYTVLEPRYDTSYQVISPERNVEAEGSFDIFIDKSIYESAEDYYAVKSWHYSYSAYNYKTVHNNNADYGNVLILGDSYEASMVPFLSLGIKNVKVIVPRELTGSVREDVGSGDYDTVIIAYAQFMIGAHDDETSANYRMFTLD